MIEIIKKYEEPKIVEKFCKESGLKIHFKNFDEMIDSLEKLKRIARIKTDKLEECAKVSEKEYLDESMKTFSFFERVFTQRKEYTDSIEKSKTKKEETEALVAKYKKLQNIFTKLNNILISANIAKESFLAKEKLQDFGYDYHSAKNLIESLGFDVVLTIEDLKSFNPNKDKKIESFDDYVAVHITSYAPNNCIKTSYSATKDNILKSFETHSKTNIDNYKDGVLLGNKYYNIPYQSFRDTIHFCINSPVMGGFFAASDWEKMKYAVICPYNDIKSQIKAAVPQDTFISGDYQFTDKTHIICPISEKNKLKSLNPNTNIIYYDDSQNYEKDSAKSNIIATAHSFAPFVISNVLGYKFLDNHPTLGFVDAAETKKYVEMAKSEGFNCEMHAYTQSKEIEEEKHEIYIMAVMLSIIEKENLTFDDIKENFVEVLKVVNEDLIEETLSFLKPKIGQNKYNKLVSQIKTLSREKQKIKDSMGYDKKIDIIKSVVDEISESKEQQPGA